MIQLQQRFLRLYAAAPILLMLGLASCNFFNPSSADTTLQADAAARGTSVALLRETATVESVRMGGTAESAQTAVRSADQQSTRIASTLIAGGASGIDISRITPVAPQQAPADSGSGQPVPIVLPTLGAGSAQGNTSLNTPVPTPLLVENAAPAGGAGIEATPDADAASLTNLTVSDGVGADDCATGSVTSFADTAEGVYIVATANNVSPANVVTARFLYGGTEAVYYDWSPGFDIAEACIWFYMPAADVQFGAGSWSASLELDGVPVGTPLAFTVTGSEAGAETGGETGSG